MHSLSLTAAAPLILICTAQVYPDQTASMITPKEANVW
jgi:hypothetical protein